MAAINIAIIGAGMAGLKAAATLHRTGVNITVFEKSRGMGGRLATRRTKVGNFNHGAQYVTALHPDFRAFLQQAENRKAAQNWNPNLHRRESLRCHRSKGSIGYQLRQIRETERSSPQSPRESG